MSTTLTHPNEGQSRVTEFLKDAHRGSPKLWINGWIMLALFAVCSFLPLFDVRTLIGVSVWEKPMKFFLSIGLHFLTIAWALSLAQATTRQYRSFRWSINALLAASWLELMIISTRAFRGEASHFNTETMLDGLFYSMMGVGAVTMTFSSGLIGFRIWQNRRSSVWADAAGVGLMLGAVLATITAGYMSSQQAGHWVGGDLTDATGLPFFHWSTTGGDLRVAHFIGLHAMQIVPFAALSGKRALVYLAAAVVVALTIATFMQAVMGVPLFRTSQ